MQNYCSIRIKGKHYKSVNGPEFWTAYYSLRSILLAADLVQISDKYGTEGVIVKLS
jgi:hypothetical protein